jgi:hypothetical protein
MRGLAPARVVALVALALVLAGCGPSAKDEEKAAAASPTPSAEPSKPVKKKHHMKKPTSVPTPDITVPNISLPPISKGLVYGGDVSWPQCPKGMGIPQKRSLGLPMPLPSSKFVILGLTNGPSFVANPCLADQVQWVRERHLMAAAYAVHSWPDVKTIQRYGNKGPYDGSTRLGALSNVGYQQSLFDVGTMRSAGLLSPIIWLDVESVPYFPWSSDRVANAAVIKGAAKGYTEAGYSIGAYGTTAIWQGIVGDLTFGIPEWRAAGQTSQAEALARCGADRVIQGGDSVIAQWVEDGRDRNVTCPGTSSEMFRWFTQY